MLRRAPRGAVAVSRCVRGAHASGACSRGARARQQRHYYRGCVQGQSRSSLRSVCLDPALASKERLVCYSRDCSVVRLFDCSALTQFFSIVSTKATPVLPVRWGLFGSPPSLNPGKGAPASSPPSRLPAFPLARRLTAVAAVTAGGQAGGQRAGGHCQSRNPPQPPSCFNAIWLECWN